MDKDKKIRKVLVYLNNQISVVNQSETEEVKEILEDAPDSPMANAILAGVCLSRGKNEEAQKAMQVAVKSAPVGADDTRVTGILGTGP